jgi:hypothetical protein
LEWLWLECQVAEATNVVEENFPKAELTDIENTTKIADPDTEPKIVFLNGEGADANTSVG